MPVSTLPGPSSTRYRAPSAARWSRVWRHRTGLQSWAASRPPHSVAVGVGPGVDVGVDGHLGLAQLGGVDGLAESLPGGSHERGVEGAADRHGHDLLGAELLGDRRRLGDGLGLAGDDDLARERCSWRPTRRRRPGHRRPRRRRRRARARRPSCRCGRWPPRAWRRPARPRAGDRRRRRGRRRPPARCTRRGCGRPRRPASTPRRSTASSTTRLVRKVESWALSVSLSSSASVCEQERLEVTTEDGRRLDDQLPRGVLVPGRAHPGLLGPLAGEGEHDHRWVRTSGQQRAVV